MLPLILYLIQTVPILLPHSYFAHMHLLLLNFIWNLHTCVSSYTHQALKRHRSPRPVTSYASKLSRGIDLSDLLQDYKSLHFVLVVDWPCHAARKQWVQVAQGSA